MDRAAALAIAGRYVPAEQADALLTEHTVTRTVLGVPVPLYDPYAAALAWLMNPVTVKSRTEGSVSESYIEPEKVAAYLEGQSLALRESWPVGDVSGEPLAFNLELDVQGWG